MPFNQQNLEWALNYADAVAGLDPRFSKNAKQVEAAEINEVMGLLNSAGVNGQENNPKNQCIRAELLLQKGIIEESQKIFESLLESQSDLPEKWLLRVQTWFAWTSAAMGKMDIALATIRDVIESDTSLLGAQQVLAEILALSEDTQDAINQAQLVVELAPDLAENLLWAGELFSNLGENEKAIQVLSDGAKLNPDDLRFDLSLAQVYEKLGNSEEEKNFVNGLKGKVNSNTSTKVLASVSKILDKFEEDTTVEQILQDKFTSAPTIQNALNLAGYRFQHNDAESALEVLEIAGEKNPGNTLIACCKVDTLANMNEFEKALVEIQGCKDIKPLGESVDLNSFIPQTWQLIKQSKNPMDELSARLNFETGKMDVSLEISEKILSRRC